MKFHCMYELLTNTENFTTTKLNKGKHMEKKSTIISLIALGIIIACSALYIILSGITTKNYNYVQLEVNPKVEFICDKKFSILNSQFSIFV